VKLQFKVQPYQTVAVDAVVNCFDGQPKIDGISYQIDPGVRASRGMSAISANEFSDSGMRNAEIQLGTAQLLENLRNVQRVGGLPISTKLEGSKAAPGAPNLDVEMETGTGKTYVYIKTMMELHKRYGWSKYIVVVPSVAIREGVKKSFDVTADHFQQLYGTKPRAFVYDSSDLPEVESFSSSAGVQVMIINIQAFNAAADAETKATAGKRHSDQARRIFRRIDDFQSRRPIDVIAANRPILIVDEPQKVEGDPKKPSKSLKALAEFNALMILRYSATHRVEHTKVHRLDAVDAYNQKLVKRIAVRGITVKGLAGSTAYLYLDSIEVKKGQQPSARIELEIQTKGGPITRQTKRVTMGSRLHDLANGVEAYRDLVVTNVDAVRDVIELSNGDTVVAGQLADRDVTEDQKRRIQIREVIRAHLDKERELFNQGVKVLSLFFIDEVAKYRDYAREDTLGGYARVFEEEYSLAVADIFDELELDEATTAYRDYLQRDEVRSVHEGYFSIDKKSRHLVDPKINKTGDDKGQSSDVDAYDLILKDKERLLSLTEPVRFIFSHSALREGWDNPNVFVMGMLKKSDNMISRRQEIGRGLRLAVDQHGERMDDPNTVHDINELTVVTDESYTDFVAGLQREIAESLSARPRTATAKFFTGKVVTRVDGDGEEHELKLTPDHARQLQHWLTVNGYTDYEHHLTDEWLQLDKADVAPLPSGLEPFAPQIAELVDSLHLDIPIGDGRKPKQIPLNEANFNKKEFQELWARINHKAVYQVEFDSTELITKCVAALDKNLTVTALQYVIVEGQQAATVDVDNLEKGESFTVTNTTTEAEAVTASSQVRYDLLGEITEKTQLTRRTASAILQGVQPGTFGKYRQNPEQFITEAAKLINEQKAAVIVEHLTYDTLAERHDTAIFTENQTRQDFSKAGSKLKKHVYDYVVVDSKVERSFVDELDTSSEVVVYAKLPRGFFIPTPVGNYNPDWAIAFQEGSVKHVYFVAETKGSLSSLQLKGVENAKIECARKFFATLGGSSDQAVKYDVVTDYGELMQLVGGRS